MGELELGLLTSQERNSRSRRQNESSVPVHNVFNNFFLLRENVRRVNQCLTNHLNIGLPAGVCKCIVMSGLCIDCLSPCVWRLTGCVLLRLELHRRPAYSK